MRRPALLSRTAVLLLALAAVLALLLCAEGAWAQDDDLDAETVSLDDLVDEEAAAEDAAAAAEEAAAPAEPEDISDFDIVEALGADLACSACELTMDTLVRNYASASSHIRRRLEDEAAAKLKADEEANAAAEAAKDEGDEETIELGTTADAEEEQEEQEEEGKDTEGSEEGDNGGKKNKKNKKNKKDKKDKKDKKKKKGKNDKKKRPEIKVDPKKVAAVVMQAPCNASDFVGVKTIGTYPGRRYDSYGAGLGSYDFSQKSKKKQAKELEKVSDLVKACRKLTEKEGEDTWLQQKLASPSSRSSKSLKKIKSDFCVKRHKMCKSAALGFEAESACLAKMLRHMAAGEFDKATKLSKKCPKESVVKSA